MDCICLTGLEQLLRAQGCSVATVELRVWAVRAVMRFRGLGCARGLTTEDVRAVLAMRRWAPESRCALAAGVSAWVRFAGLPVDVPRVRAAPRQIPRPADPDGVVAALAATTDPVLRAWIGLGRWAGLRAGEVARLLPSDVDLGRGWLTVRQGKGGRSRALPIHRQLRPLLREVLLAGWWPSVEPSTVSVRVGVMLRRHRAGGRFHELRHRCLTDVAQSGGLLVAQKMAGHANPSTTTRYTLLSDASLVAAVDAMA